MDKPINSKNVFLDSEGDAWFSRNKTAVQRSVHDDPVARAITELPQLGHGTTVLEIGAGGGDRLDLLQKVYGFRCSGIEPSELAVEHAKRLGVNAIRGTADQLPFPDNSFDIVIFGFCLYLCDRADLFRIAAEADRVLRSPGWLVLLDFFSEFPSQRPYHHRPGIFSYKMDYRTLFSWHPFYTCMQHEIRRHVDNGFTDDPHEWVALSVLRKHENGIPE